MQSSWGMDSGGGAGANVGTAVALGSESASDPWGNSCSEVTCSPLDVLSSRMVYGFVKALLAILLSTLGG